MVTVGLDLGQRQDHTAVVVVERRQAHPYLTQPDATMQVRAAERFPLGVSYAEVVEMVRHVVQVAWAESAKSGCRLPVKLAVDSTGLGRPVVEMLRTSLLGAGLGGMVLPGAYCGCLITAVTITGGDRQNYRPGEASSMNVPKQDLISGLQVALDRGHLRIAAGMRDAGRLTRGLLDVRMRSRETGHVRYGAEGRGKHDDLVIALALAVWRAQKF